MRFRQKQEASARREGNASATGPVNRTSNTCKTETASSLWRCTYLLRNQRPHRCQVPHRHGLLPDRLPGLCWDTFPPHNQLARGGRLCRTSFSKAGGVAWLTSALSGHAAGRNRRPQLQSHIHTARYGSAGWPFRQAQAVSNLSSEICHITLFGIGACCCDMLAIFASACCIGAHASM